MVFKYSRKGQAAIEFLMTYGWMLLVVLIVGALIFSFVDFGSLLPNQIDLSNNLRADNGQSFATANGDYALVTFFYTGAQQVKIGPTDGVIVSKITPSENCTMNWIKNVDTDSGNPVSSPSNSALSATTDVSPNSVVFINGQYGIATFDCSNLNGGNGLLENDVLEGKITIQVTNARTSVPVPSSGNLRLQITS